MESLIAHEASLRFYLLIGGFGLVAVWEALMPRRVPAPPARNRWAVNIGLTVLLSVVVGVAFPVLSVGMALVAANQGFGLFHATAWPAWIELTLAFLLLDLGRYGQHALLHRVPLLWRLHRVHHTDVDYDCTTALRFHPLEALVAVGLQLALVAGLGAAAGVVLLYEAVSVLAALFSHGNVRLAPSIDAALRRVVVTPDLHRIHHSVLTTESNANYGGVLPWWDRLFGTYRAQPIGGHNAMAIGLPEVRDVRAGRLTWLLASPFVSARRFAAPLALPASRTR